MGCQPPAHKITLVVSPAIGRRTVSFAMAMNIPGPILQLPEHPDNAEAPDAPVACRARAPPPVAGRTGPAVARRQWAARRGAPRASPGGGRLVRAGAGAHPERVRAARASRRRP